VLRGVDDEGDDGVIAPEITVTVLVRQGCRFTW